MKKVRTVQTKKMSKLRNGEYPPTMAGMKKLVTEQDSQLFKLRRELDQLRMVSATFSRWLSANSGDLVELRKTKGS